MSGSKAAKELLRGKLQELETAFAIAIDAAEKFRLKSQIEELRIELGLPWSGNRFEHLGPEAIDRELLKGFFSECRRHDPEVFSPLMGAEGPSVHEFLVSSGLARFVDTGIVLTEEGVLLCARREVIPRDRLHVTVTIEWREGRQSQNTTFFGSVLFLHQRLRERLAHLYASPVGTPDQRTSSGSETVFYEVPPEALNEALTNFLIHRDYDEDDFGRVNVLPDRVELVNPGTSLIPIADLLAAEQPLEPRYRRNPRLIEAMNLARYNERRGSGMQRIRDSLVANGSFKPDGTVGLELWNDDEKQRFHLVLYRRDLAKLHHPSARTARSEPAQRIAPSRLPRAGGQLFGREAALAVLEKAWSGGEVNVLTVVAWGGTGKSALVGRFAAELAARAYDGADYFDWTFYSQGTQGDGAASGDAFVNAALRHFGDGPSGESVVSSWEKGAKLARLLASRRSLLILDGLEPLQYPAGPQRGELKDPALTALLRGLAQLNPGLCVVTTREKVAELEMYQGRTVAQLDLDQLEPAAGCRFLESLGVRGAPGEIAKLVADVEGHALTLNLVGRYLARAHGGDVRRRDQVDLRVADAKLLHGHAFEGMAAYERWLLAGGEAGQRQLAILRLLGLFDRPASFGCIEALRRAPMIAELTEAVQELNDFDWSDALANLVDADLVVCTGVTGDHGTWAVGASLDSHPLLREYFAGRLRERHPAAWYAAHGRLYEHLRDSTEYRPATLEGLQPLYQAVRHGCLAGRHQEACDAVYHDRILRGTASDGFYSWKTLGAFAADLGAVANFFDERWSQPSHGLTEAARAWLLNEAAIHLRALGRLREALEPLRASLATDVAREDWKGAAISAANLCQLLATSGDLRAALEAGTVAIDYADRSGDAAQRTLSRAALASASGWAGQKNEAEDLFRQAEAMQGEWQPEYPLLYANRGFGYCDLLLADAERLSWARRQEGASVGELVACAEVERRALTLQQWRASDEPLLTIGLDHLALGRSRLYRAILTGAAPSLAQADVAAAVESLRAAGDSTVLPEVLLTRARLRHHLGDAPGAREDLEEAWAIATRGPMPLVQADVLLFRARLFDVPGDLVAAQQLIVKHGYGRRVGELEDAQAWLGGSGA